MTKFDADNLNAPHTLRELGVEPSPAVDVSTEAVMRLVERLRSQEAIPNRGEVADAVLALLARAQAAEVDAVAARRAEPISADDIAIIIERTEVSDMTASGDRRWTRRMADALAAKQFLSAQPITVQDAALCEHVAFSLWKAEADRAAPNVGRLRTPDVFEAEDENTRAKWLSQAAAALRAIAEGKT